MARFHFALFSRLHHGDGAPRASLESPYTIHSLSTMATTINGSAVLVLASIALAVAGSYPLALATVLLALVWLCCSSTSSLSLEDQLEIKFNIWEAPDILQEMARSDGDRAVLVAGLHALARKYHPDTALLCQDAAYLALQSSDDTILAAALSLLALCAKREDVRERHQADVYGLDRPLDAIRASLLRAKELHDPKLEQQAAEVQRKACLWMGALSDGDTASAQLVAGEGGIEAILAAVDWYRYHSEVGNWGLWALFVLCFEAKTNKEVLVRENGVPIVVRVVENCAESVDVARHGLALLFDLMREDEETRVDVWAVRKSALAAGLHDAVSLAMVNHNEMDIMMMGQELLVGTNYGGDVPRYKNQESS